MSPLNADHAFYQPYGSYYFLMLLFIGAMIGIVTANNFFAGIFFLGDNNTLFMGINFIYKGLKKLHFLVLKHLL